jgi:hypothetical protein
MKKTIGFGLAFAVLASLATAGGEGEKDKAKNKAKNKSTRTLEKMATSQGGAANVNAAPGTGFTIDLGDDFSLNISNRLQFLARYSDVDTNPAGISDTTNFSIARARTILRGHVWDTSKTYKVQLDWARDSAGDILLDAWFNWDFWESEDGTNQVGLRVGQQKPHHGREFQGSFAYLEHTQRSLPSQTFTGFRVTGAYLHGTHLEGDKLHWWAGAGNSDPAQASVATNGGSNGASSSQNEVNYFFDVRFDPFGDYGDEGFQQGDLEGTEDLAATVGASVMVGNHKGGVGGTADTETVSIVAYGGLKYQGVHALLEFFGRSDDIQGGAETDSNGIAVGGSYIMPPAEEGGSQWGFAGRWSITELDDPPTNLLLATPLTFFGAGTTGQISEIEGTVSHYYKQHRLKSQVGYRYQQVDPDVGQDIDNHFIDILFQWMF